MAQLDDLEGIFQFGDFYSIQFRDDHQKCNIHSVVLAESITLSRTFWDFLSLSQVTHTSSQNLNILLANQNKKNPRCLRYSDVQKTASVY